MTKSWRIVGSVAMLALLAWRLDWAQLGEAFARLNLGLWALAVLVYLLATLVSSLRWQWFAQPLGFDVRWRGYAALYFMGLFFNLVLPSSVGGDVVRAWYLGCGKRRGAAALSVLAERGSGLGLLIVMACIAGLFVQDAMPRWMHLILLLLACGVLLGVACLPLLPALARSPLLGKRGALISLAMDVYGSQPGLLALTAVLSLVVQAASVLMVALIALALGIDVPPAYLAVVVPLVALLTLVPVSINGMGLRELGLAILLAPAGVSSASAVMLSLLQFAAMAAVSLLGAGFYLMGSYPRLETASPDIQEEGLGDAEVVRGNSDQGRTGQPASAA